MALFSKKKIMKRIRVNKMKRNKLFVSMVLSSTSLLLLTSLGLFNKGSATYSSPNELWVHYPKKEASEKENGIREYWIECSTHRYQFSKPNSSNIQEYTSYNTDGFSENDPRWIKYIPSYKNAFFDLSSNTFDFSEINISGYTPTDSVSNEPGSKIRTDFTKDNLSPSYNLECLTVSDVISSNDELSSFCKSIDGKEISGYYVLTSDLKSPSSYLNNQNGTNKFKATFDGRNHTISNPTTWGHRLFGWIKDATIKNLNFDDISIFSVLGTVVENSTIENCSFKTASTLNAWSNVGILCDEFYSGVKLKNVIVDMGQNALKIKNKGFTASALSAYNSSTLENPVTYDNVSINCLNSTKAYVGDRQGRSLRPEEIKFTSTYKFIDNGQLNYDIKYLKGNSQIEKAAKLIKEEIDKGTGQSIKISSIDDSITYNENTSSIILGSSSFSNYQQQTLPSEAGSFVLKGIGKAIYLNSNYDEGYQVGAIKLLESLIGYDYIGADTIAYKVEDKTNVDLPYLDLTFTPSFGYRKCDWSDHKDIEGITTDCYKYGYNAGYAEYGYYLGTEAMGTLPAETFHTSLHILYPGTYYSSHPNWYAVNENGNNYGDKYNLWQLCFSAHGDSNEYEAMVNEATNNVIKKFASSNNLNIKTLLLGTEDNNNYCHCSSCKKKASEYGSIAGTVINFVNDVANRVNNRISETKRSAIDIGLFAYLGYKDAPIKNGSPTIKTNDNVFTLVAPIQANYTYSLLDERNASSKNMFEDWAKVGKISAWLYETNFSNYLYPFNSFKANFENFKYLKKKNVFMAYAQGQHNAVQPRTGFTALKKYLNAKVMLDVNSDYNTLLNNFFSSYYGEAGDKMRTFFNEMVAQLETIESTSDYQNTLYNNNQFSIYENIATAKFWDFDLLKKWVSLCDEAANLVTSIEAKKHILCEKIFPSFALSSLYSGFAYIYKWGTTSKRKEFQKEFKTLATELGFKTTSESGTKLETYYNDWGI